jgi:drug/metabolite transporter (DMT)-like permease
LTLTVFLIVLAAAAIHAVWNAVLKGAGSALMATVLVAAVSGLLSLLALPFLPPPAPASFPWLGASLVAQVGYYLLLANAYRTGDLSRTYPIMRGTAPLIVVLVSTLWLGEVIGPWGWIGVGLVSLGIFTLVLVRPTGAGGRVGAPGTGFALANGFAIAGYTLLDGVGVRLAGSLSYVLWLFILTGGVLLAWAIAARRAELLAALRPLLPRILVAGFGNLAAYVLILWAMTQAPIPLVAALRETSILFGTVIAALVFREPVGAWRIAAVLTIAVGAVALRLS